MKAYRGVINGKAAKAAALFSDTLTLSQPKGADYAQPLALPRLKKFLDNASGISLIFNKCSILL
jgi:hypothetical protein